MFGFGKEKKLQEEARKSLAEFHQFLQKFSDTGLAGVLDSAEQVRMEIEMTQAGARMGSDLNLFFENPFAMNERQLEGMLDWCKQIAQQFKAQGSDMRLTGLSVWVCNGLCARHTDLLPLGQALWQDLKRAEGNTNEFEWDRYMLLRKQFGAI